MKWVTSAVTWSCVCLLRGSLSTSASGRVLSPLERYKYMFVKDGG